MKKWLVTNSRARIVHFDMMKVDSNVLKSCLLSKRKPYYVSHHLKSSTVRVRPLAHHAHYPSGLSVWIRKMYKQQIISWTKNVSAGQNWENLVQRHYLIYSNPVKQRAKE